MTGLPTVVVMKEPKPPEGGALIDFVVAVSYGGPKQRLVFGETEFDKAVAYYRDVPDQDDADLYALGVDDRHEKVMTAWTGRRWTPWEAC